MSRGYLEVIINEKVNSAGKVIKSLNGDSIIIFDKIKVLTTIDSNHNYPLLGYVKRFKASAKLEVIDSLFFKSLERKTVKKLWYSALKIYGIDYQELKKNNEALKEIEEVIISYHQPLL